MLGFGNGRNNGDGNIRRGSTSPDPYSRAQSDAKSDSANTCHNCNGSHQNSYVRPCSWTVIFLLAIDLFTIILFVIMLQDHSDHFRGKIKGGTFNLGENQGYNYQGQDLILLLQLTVTILPTIHEIRPEGLFLNTGRRISIDEGQRISISIKLKYNPEQYQVVKMKHWGTKGERMTPTKSLPKVNRLPKRRAHGHPYLSCQRQPL